MPHSSYEDVRVTGHLIDSGIMSAIMDAVVAHDAEFETLEFEVGRTNEDPSSAVLRIRAKDREALDEVMRIVQEQGAVPIDPGARAVSSPVPALAGTPGPCAHNCQCDEKRLTSIVSYRPLEAPPFATGPTVERS